MTSTEIVTYICDLNPEDGEATSHRLTLDGKTVDIDLCAECLDPLAGYMEGGRPVQAARAPGSRRVQRTAAGNRLMEDRQHTLEIRAWATGEGLVTKDRGRLPKSVIAAYDAAHAGSAR